jgi:predicted DNA-binding protein
MASKRYKVFTASFTDEQYVFLKALSEKNGEPIATTLRALVEKEKRASLFLTSDVLEYTMHSEAQHEPVPA